MKRHQPDKKSSRSTTRPRRSGHGRVIGAICGACLLPIVLLAGAPHWPSSNHEARSGVWGITSAHAGSPGDRLRQAQQRQHQARQSSQRYTSSYRDRISNARRIKRPSADGQREELLYRGRYETRQRIKSLDRQRDLDIDRRASMESLSPPRVPAPEFKKSSEEQRPFPTDDYSDVGE